MSALTRFPGLSKLLRDTELSGRPAVLLDAQYSEHPDSGASILALDPADTLVWLDESAHSNRDNNSVPWTALKAFRETAKGWVFGYFSYELNHRNFGLAPRSLDGTVKGDFSPESQSVDEGAPPSLQSQSDAAQIPSMWFIRPSTVLRFNHTSGEIEVLVDEAGKAAQYLDVIFARADESSQDEMLPPPDENSRKHFGFQLNSPVFSDRNRYTQLVNLIKDDIREGEYYEVNFTYPIRMDFKGDLLELAKAMFSRGNIPFGAVILGGAESSVTLGLGVVSVSPERFLKRKGRTVFSQPIKGTVARGKDEQHDRVLVKELLNEKNKAENLMIVDLVRNDLNMVCEPGSVHVPRLFEVQTFGTVHQLVSTVQGTLPADMDPVDVIQACYPMGSMTGAPKRAAMHSIHRNEENARGIYSGAIGYITPDGDFDFNVAIRTCVFPPVPSPSSLSDSLSTRPLVYHVGGAITGDSDPELEWDETLVKARGLLDLVSGDSTVL